jgi:hypothetical protein
MLIAQQKLDNFLSNDPQPIGRLRKSNDTIGIHRRTKLYEILSKAYRLDLSNNTWVQDTMNLQNVFLLGHKVNTATESSTELMPWLQGITNSDHSRFFFPKKKDGPDLLFVLGQKNTKLLCVLQVCAPLIWLNPSVAALTIALKAENRQRRASARKSQRSHVVPREGSQRRSI